MAISSSMKTTLLILVLLVTIITAASPSAKQREWWRRCFSSDQHCSLAAKSPSSFDEDAYYDGDLQAPELPILPKKVDCSVQCAPQWTEPVLQYRQSLVYPTSAVVSLRCPFEAKPKAKVTWLKDGQLFTPDLPELVTQRSTSFRLTAFVLHRFSLRSTIRV